MEVKRRGSTQTQLPPNKWSNPLKTQGLIKDFWDTGGSLVPVVCSPADRSPIKPLSLFSDRSLIKIAFCPK